MLFLHAYIYILTRVIKKKKIILQFIDVTIFALA